MVSIVLLDTLIFKEKIIYGIMYSLYLPIFLRVVYFLKIIMRLEDASCYEVIKLKGLEFLLFPVITMFFAYGVSKNLVLSYASAGISLLSEIYIAIKRKSKIQ